ncbi:PepSY domain-containing protein [Clostridium tertium]|nr:PepSY domain-containing protein [Clostridium tertium]MDB1932998.1 PepSY domain-containing protein [Clostridium tertium]MDB1938358.1 PepSY domain-containing protein [Clostridium tertium]
MKKLLPIIMISIAMSISGCNNKDINDNINKSDTRKVTLEQAKEIALKHANLINDQVSFIRAETDLDNGIEKYDIEFYHENIEYDYEINVANGEII